MYCTSATYNILQLLIGCRHHIQGLLRDEYLHLAGSLKLHSWMDLTCIMQEDGQD
jgi:hypothetical protein